MIRLIDAQLFRSDLQTRMPFKYGIATMTHLPHVFLRATMEIDGAAQVGIAADHLPPKWFTKDPTRDPVEEIDEMLRVIRHAMSAASKVEASTVFGFWQGILAEQGAWGGREKLPPLLTHFGTSLVERVAIDAYARHHQVPFHQLLKTDAFQMRLETFHSELKGSRLADWLPAVPRSKVFARHTVGLADLLTDADVAATGKEYDGLPASLEACIRTYGLRHFKIKITGKGNEDVDRLDQIAAVIAAHAPADYAYSLDGNESFLSVAALHDFLAEAGKRPRLREFFRHMLFIEQPLHRDRALKDDAGFDSTWPERPPMIIDESDAEIRSLADALRLGYAGTSHKNCKGVFKGIANACRIAQLRRGQPASHYIMSGEDLGNIGPVALPQDLAVQAAIGVESVERNGHHYFAGLSFWPVDLQTAMLEQHGDLYRRHDRGWPTLDVRGGRLDLGSVNAAPFGIAFLPNVESFATLVD